MEELNTMCFNGASKGEESLERKLQTGDNIKVDFKMKCDRV